MKILHVINNLATGGAENIIANMIPYLCKEGFEVDVLLLEKTDSIYTKDLEKVGINIIYTDAPKMYSLKQIKEIRKIIKDYDLVHTHLFPTQYLVVLASMTIRKRIRLITTEHNTYNRRRGIPIFKYIDRFFYGKYDVVISNSKETNKNLIEFIGKREDKYIVIDNGINLDKFKNASKYNKKELNLNLSEEDILLLQVARFNYEKDQKTTIKTLSLLDSKYKLILVGDGNLRNECESYAKELGVEERVHFLGIRNDVPSIMKTSDICIVSSHIEGFGLTAVESMASGKPLIASNVDGLSSVVGNSGLLFDKGDSENLKNHIEKLVQDSSYYDFVKNECMRRANDFDIEKMVKEHISIYTN